MLTVSMCAPRRALTISARPTLACASRRSGLIGRAALDSTRVSTARRRKDVDCGKCAACLDKPAFGGRNLKRKACEAVAAERQRRRRAGDESNAEKDDETNRSQVQASRPLPTSPSLAC